MLKYNYTKTGEKTLVNVLFLYMHGCVLVKKYLCVCVCMHFIRDLFDLRQLLAMLHRHCTRQQLGQLAKKDGMKRRGGGQSRWREKKDSVNRGKDRKEVCNKRERIDWWRDGEIGKGKHDEALTEKYFFES